MSSDVVMAVMCDVGQQKLPGPEMPPHLLHGVARCQHVRPVDKTILDKKGEGPPLHSAAWHV